jgi:hypothetical protein
MCDKVALSALGFAQLSLPTRLSRGLDPISFSDEVLVTAQSFVLKFCDLVTSERNDRVGYF